MGLVHCYKTTHFWATVCKTLRTHYRSVVWLSVCDVGVLWPNDWTDQDETWHAGRPRPWPHCVRWGPTSPPLKGHSPQFSAHICCGQMAAWIKMPIGMEWPRLRRHCVRWGPRSPSPKRGHSPNFLPMFIVSKPLDGSRWYLAWR